MALEYDFDTLTSAPTAYYFSGSAVLDEHRTSGFCKPTQTPIVAIFTISYVGNQVVSGNRTILDGQQSQGIAYSCDGGISFTKYAKNPVILLPPPGHEDQYNQFRDPFVFWFAAKNKWIMVASLADEHMLLIYQSSDLKNWKYLSDFGPVNAQGKFST